MEDDAQVEGEDDEEEVDWRPTKRVKSKQRRENRD